MNYVVINQNLLKVLQIFTILVVCCIMLNSIVLAEPNNDSELEVVDDVDLSRYLGLWYEIGLIPVWFQNGCAGGTTAEYSLLKDGVVNVVNRCCTEDGKVKEAKGRAWVVDKKIPAKLKVSFVSLLGLWFFKGHYWIIDLDPDCQYAVVGHPSRDLGWILSRTPTLSEKVLQGIAERLTANGYDFSRFKMTNQTEISCSPATQDK
jgi:apolipoprotein D and lipocalin family protein